MRSNGRVRVPSREKRMRWTILLVVLLAAAPSARADSLDQLYEKAKAEKSLVLYTGAGPAAAKAAADAFEKRFPGIAVTAKGDFSNRLDREIDRQVRDKKVVVDVAQLQTIQDFRRWDKRGAVLHFKPEGFEQVLAPMKDKNGAFVAVNAVPLFYGYNAQKLSAAEAPKSARDFLKPEFRGKLVTCYPADDDATLYDFWLIEKTYGRSWMTRYMANQPVFVQGHRDVAARVKAGTQPASFDMSNSSFGAGSDPTLTRALPAEDKIPVFFTAVGILKAAPHPNAAKLFVTWMLSREQQGRNPNLYSPRRDVPPPAGLPPLTSPKFANGYRDFVGDGVRLAEIRKRYAAITGPVVNKSTVP